MYTKNSSSFFLVAYISLPSKTIHTCADLSRGYYDFYRNKDYISDLSDSMETEKNDYANLKPFYKGMFSKSPHNKDLFNTDEEAVQAKREENLVMANRCIPI